MDTDKWLEALEALHRAPPDISIVAEDIMLCGASWWRITTDGDVEHIPPKVWAWDEEVASMPARR